MPDFGEPGVQAITAAVICARGSSNLNSVTELKEITEIIQDIWWDGYLVPEESPGEYVHHFNTFALGNNYPNPFNNTTAIRYIVPHDETVRLTIYNVRGQKIRDLLEIEQIEGQHTAEWDGKDNGGNPVPSGLYLCVMEAGLFFSTTKMVVVK